MSTRTSFSRDRPARILVVDDHPMIRDGLRVHVSSCDDLTVCGEAATQDEALALLESEKPDVALVDLSLRSGHGLELIKIIRDRHPGVKALVISAYEESLFAERCLRAGALGYINKQSVQGEVIDAIRSVLDGRIHVSPEMSERLIGRALRGQDTSGSSPVDCLTDREMQVFQLIGQGIGTGEAAKELHLSVHTIESHREKIRAKLGLRDGSELMRSAVQWVLENG